MLLRKSVSARLALCVLLFLALITLASCNGVPVSTQWKLRSFNPATADVAQLRVAVRPPTWAVLTPEKTILTARYEFTDGAPGRSLDIHLRRAVHESDRAALAEIAAAPETLIVYEASPSESDAIRAYQAEMRSAKQAGRHGRGVIEINGQTACRLADVPDGPIFIDAYIHASDEIGWLVLAEGYDMTGAMRPEDSSDARIPVCAKEPRAAR